jgi:hypothetical protein
VAEETAASPSNPGVDPAANPQTLERPAGIPDQFWDAKTGVKIPDFVKAYTESQEFISRGRSAYDGERLKNRPAAADKYEIKLDPQTLGDIVLMDKVPEGFKAEAGKRYFQLDAQSPLLNFWRQHCYDNGFGGEAFNKGVAEFVKFMGGQEPTLDEVAEERKAFYGKLGENGQARVAFAWNNLKTLIGDKAAGLDDLIETPGAFEALEALLERAGSPKFAAGQNTQTTGSETAKAEIARIRGEAMKDPKHAYRDPAHPEHKIITEKMEKLHQQAYPA